MKTTACFFASTLLLAGACATQSNKPTPVATAAKVPQGLKPQLPTLCATLEEEARKPDVAQAPAADRMTMVLTNMGNANADFRVFVDEVAKVEPAGRRDAFIRGVGEAQGKAWECPQFTSLWNGV